jgi:hypothetical protein
VENGGSLLQLRLGSEYVTCTSVGVDRTVCDDSGFLSGCAYNANLQTNQCFCSGDGTVLVECLDFQETVVDLSGSGIEIVGAAAFATFTTAVTDLYLHDNRIERVEKGAFASLLNLQVLDLGSNQLVALDPASFEGLEVLVELRLHNNPLPFVTSSSFYQGLSSLQVLWLTANPLLEAVGVGLLTNLKYLYIFGTDVSCRDVSYGASIPTCRYVRLFVI